MRTTTIVWSFDPVDGVSTETLESNRASNSERLAQAAQHLGGALYRAPLSSEYNEDKTRLTVKRGWPDLATAEAWIALVQQESVTSLNNNLVSAQVDPE